MGVASERDLTAEFLGVEFLSLLEGEGIGGEEGWRRQPVDGRRGRHEQNVDFALGRCPQRGQALGDEILMRRKMVIGQRFPVRQQTDAQLWSKPRNFVEQALGIGGAGADDSQQLARVARG